MKSKSILATAALGTTLTVGAIGIGVVPAIAGAQTTDSTAVAANGHDHTSLRLHHLLRHEGQVAASAIGVEPKELRADLKSGQSVAEVAQSKGVDPQTVIDAIDADLGAKLDTAVSNGKITRERADAAEANLPERVTAVVNAHRGDRPLRPAAN